MNAEEKKTIAGSVAGKAAAAAAVQAQKSSGWKRLIWSIGAAIAAAVAWFATSSEQLQPQAVEQTAETAAL